MLVNADCCPKGVYKGAALAGHCNPVGGKQKQRTSNLSECLSLIDFYSAECPPPGHKYRKPVDAQLSCKLMAAEYEMSATDEHWSVKKYESLTSFVMESTT